MAKKKIFDIIPPKEESKIIPSIQPIDYDQNKKISPTRLGTRLAFNFKLMALILFPLIAWGIIGLIWIEPEIKIEIWPKTEKLNFQTKVIIDSHSESSNLSLGIVPGKIFKKELTVTQQFPATGKALKEGKARGIIRVYNAYSTYSQPLVATTRFVSAEGKLFRTPKRVVIPGAHYEKGKLVPGFIDIEVVADEPGEEYNIGPSTFSIPGFAGTARYTAFYGKSFEPMKGGFRKEVWVVSKQDLDQAKKILTEKALKDCELALNEEIPEDYIILKEVLKKEILEISPLAEVGQETEKFFFQVKARAEVLTFKKSDLENFARDFILSKLTPEKKLHEKSLNLIYSLKEININQNKIILNLEFSAQIYYAIDEQNLKEKIRGKNLSEIKKILKNYSQILKVNISSFPFWQKTVPNNLDQIFVELILD